MAIDGVLAKQLAVLADEEMSEHEAFAVKAALLKRIEQEVPKRGWHSRSMGIPMAAAAAVIVCGVAVTSVVHHGTVRHPIHVTATDAMANSMGISIPTVSEPHVRPPTTYTPIPLSNPPATSPNKMRPTHLYGLAALQQADFKVKVPYIPTGYKPTNMMLVKEAAANSEMVQQYFKDNQGDQIIVSVVKEPTPSFFAMGGTHETTFDNTHVQVIGWSASGHSYVFIQDGLLYRVDNVPKSRTKFLPEDDIVGWQVVDSLINGTATYN
ncbi:hypothetical protein JI721_06905 [Alicyclobacillus cycloheptanicus]|uniref:DUF4367 domain-containing protein n=1 Tax=Alicyclobacillus cycloheptanicus TaxID=1457 RepID=A0ABT9XI78_9BACL|nr:hypothetical protein [Alicyclobacillus cycloheptanicus]MDQ0189815.1 hypothetical protein [Alicyclobacillus cycloheptanicus]WDM02496.1 hypothetical protein JI721_06905 [Alicyclobacillus cycloheptanicus]